MNDINQDAHIIPLRARSWPLPLCNPCGRKRIHRVATALVNLNFWLYIYIVCNIILIIRCLEPMECNLWNLIQILLKVQRSKDMSFFDGHCSINLYSLRNYWCEKDVVIWKKEAIIKTTILECLRLMQRCMNAL